MDYYCVVKLNKQFRGIVENLNKELSGRYNLRKNLDKAEGNYRPFLLK